MKPLDIPCGACGARAHEPCRIPGKTHAVRTSAAKRGNRPPHTNDSMRAVEAPRSSMPSWLEGKV